MLTLYFNYKDVFRAVRLGLSPKKIWTMFWGFFIGFALYGIFGYAAHLAAGRSIADVWAIFGPVPLPWSDFGIWSWLLWLCGALLFLISYLMSATVAARVTAEQLAGNEFYELKEGMKYLRDNWKAVIGGPLVIILFAVFLVLVGLAVGLWGRIPVIGELTVALLTIPSFFVCLFIVFLLAALKVGLHFSPAIVGSAKSDTFDSLFEIFSCLTSQPWRLAVYSLLLAAVCLLGTAVFEGFTIAGLLIAFQTLGWAMGQKFVDIAVAGIVTYTPSWGLNLMLSLTSGINGEIGQMLAAAPELNWAGHVSAFIAGMSLNMIWLIVLSYLASSWVAGQTIIYGIIVKKRDDRNIFERKEDKAVSDARQPVAPAEASPDNG